MKRTIRNTVTLLVMFLMALQVYSQAKLNYKYEIRLLGKEVNNKYSNFGTSYYGDKVIYASPMKRSYIIKNIWTPNEQPYLDLYQGTVDSEGNLKEVKKFSNKLNTKYHEADVCFTKDLKRVYFTRNNYYKRKYVADTLGVNRLQLYTAVVGEEGEWTDIQPLPFNNKDFSTGHPTLSEDEKTLYFVSDRPGGYGATDLYKVSILGDNQYSEPKNLGNVVNTEGREMFPYVAGQELYYSTDGKSDVKGGLDVYMTEMKGDDFSTPLNLLTLNSSSDDFALIIDKSKGTGYFSSNREGGYGDDDIYYFKEIEIAKPKCIYRVLVRDKETLKVLSDSKVRMLSGDKVLSEGTTDASGYYVYTEDCVAGAVYQVEGNKKPLYGTGIKPTLAYNGDVLEQEVVIDLLPDFKRSQGKLLIKINPIYFDFDESFIRPDAAIELDKVVSIMKKYPNIRIDAGSHTDSRGRTSYNQRLSERRAKSTVDYIVSHGISSDRIIYNGYGESQLVNGCSNGVKCSEEEHQLNRRTEFVILNPEVLDQKK